MDAVLSDADPNGIEMTWYNVFFERNLICYDGNWWSDLKFWSD